MSTNSLDKIDSHLDIKCVIRFDVQNLQAALAAFVRAKMDEQNLSTYDVERRSGGSITHGSVWNILNQRVKDVKAGTLRALAKGLAVSEDEIFAIARGKSPADDSDFKNWKFASLFDDAQKLTPEQMKDFEVLMEIARREVQRMIQEQEKEAPRKPRRPPSPSKAVDVPEEKVKRRA